MPCECLRVTRRIRTQLHPLAFPHPLAFLVLAGLTIMSISACSASSTGAKNTKLAPSAQGTVYYYATFTPTGAPGQPTAPTRALVARDASTGAQRWSDTIAADSVSLVASASAVYAGVIEFAGDHASQGSLQALRADNGKLLWQIPKGSAEVFPLALSPSALFVSKATLDASGTITSDTISALSPTDGAQSWSTPLTSGYATSATLDAGTLYLAARTPSASSQTSPAVLLSLDAATGKTLWQVTIPDAAVGGLTAVSDGTVYVTERPSATSAGARPTVVVEAFKASDGSSLWKHTFAGVGSAHAATSAEVVTATNDPTQCQAATGSTPTTTPCVAPTILTALAATDGSQIWSTPLPNALPSSGTVVTSDSVYVAMLFDDTGAGAVVNLRAADGKQVWSHTIAEGAPILMRRLGSALYFATLPDVVTQSGPPSQISLIEALTSADGSLLWKKEAGYVQVTALTVAPST